MRSTSVEQVAVERLSESPVNHRQIFGDLSELADSIRTQGVLQPLLVRPMGKGLEIVIGHRRFRGSKMAGLKTVPAIIREMTEREVIEAQLVENIAREDVHPLELADGYRRLVDTGLSVPEAAKRIGLKTSTVFTALKLLDLVPEARQAYLSGRVRSAAAADAIARVKGERAQLAALHAVEVAQKKAGGPLPSRAVQTIVRKQFAGQRTKRVKVEPSVEVEDAVQARALELLLTRVGEVIERKRGLEDVELRVLVLALSGRTGGEELVRRAGVRLDRLGVASEPKLRVLAMELALRPWLGTESGAAGALARAYGLSWAETEKTARALMKADELIRG
jgi:ParB/RepB/Spo0J family partition protein